MTESVSILGALASALPMLEGAKKNKSNPAFRSKYADLSAVIEAIEPIKDHGLWFRQVSHERGDGVCIETFYIHNSGELSAGLVFVPADKKNAQGYGSANSYARRYALQTAFGLATEDDDGNAASASPPRFKSEGQVSLAPSDKVNGAVNQPHASPRAGSTEWPAGPARNKAEVRAQWAALKAKILDAVEAGDPDTLDGHLSDEKPLLKQIEIVEPKWWSGEGLPESIPGFIMEAQAEAHKNEANRLAGGLVTLNGQTIINA